MNLLSNGLTGSEEGGGGMFEGKVFNLLYPIFNVLFIIFCIYYIFKTKNKTARNSCKLCTK